MRVSIACRWIYTISIVFECFSNAQFPAISEDEFTFVPSPVDGNITIRYKSPLVGTCTTVFSTQKQYTGYITLPPNVLQPTQGNYTINTFFWFIEARQKPESAPLTVFINGGPGSSSMVGLFQEVGPCEVVEIARNRLGTVAREWGWDRSSNVLFIDQPVQVGFSYDEMANASLNLLDETLIVPPTTGPITQPTYTFINGTFASGNVSSTANTTQIAAQALWHFLQGFLAAFPVYNPGLRDGGSLTTPQVGINLFTESYGGKYGPAIGAFFQQQNFRRQSDAVFANTTLEISLETLGIMNGWIDLLTQMPFYPRFAYNNTYGLALIDQVTELNALSSYSSASGCQQLTVACRTEAFAYDSDNTGGTLLVNDACAQAQQVCQSTIIGPYSSTGRSIYDISQTSLNPFPGSNYLEYLNTQSVQKAIGVPVNYTQTSLPVFRAFNETGDYARDGNVQNIVNLLQAGVRIALIYGDRDFICNWEGGEAISYAIAGAAGPNYAPWYSAGYAPIVSNSSYIGGVVREFGNLSFSRIYDAGHLVPAYQPETTFTVFSRIIAGTDISLGNKADLSTYRSFGDVNSTHDNVAPAAASATCYLRAVNQTCDSAQKNMLANQAGVIINGVLYDRESDWIPPAGDVQGSAGVPGTAPRNMLTSVSGATTTAASGTDGSGVRTTTEIPTGVFTATTVPTTTSSSAKNEATPGLSNILKDPHSAAVVVVLGLFGYELILIA